MSRQFKRFTGLTGIKPVNNPHELLTLLYDRILVNLAKMPKEYAYRQNTEALVMERYRHIKETPSIPELEKKIDCGSIEEVVIQAKNEAHLTKKILYWRCWEPLLGNPPKDQWKWPPY